MERPFDGRQQVSVQQPYDDDDGQPVGQRPVMNDGQGVSLQQLLQWERQHGHLQ